MRYAKNKRQIGSLFNGCEKRVPVRGSIVLASHHDIVDVPFLQICNRPFIRKRAHRLAGDVVRVRRISAVSVQHPLAVADALIHVEPIESHWQLEYHRR